MIRALAAHSRRRDKSSDPASPKYNRLLERRQPTASNPACPFRLTPNINFKQEIR